MNGTVIGETVRRHITNIGFILYLAFLVIIALGVSVFDRPASGWPTMITLLALITGAAAIGPEFSSGTLQLILVKPVNRAAYLLSRVTGIVLTVWLASLVPALCELAGRAIWGKGALHAREIGIALVNSAADTLLAVSLLALLGSVTRAWFNIAIYMATLIGLSMSAVVFAMLRQSQNAVGRFLSEHTQVERAFQVVDQNLFPELPSRLDREWMLMVFCNASIALVLACLAFRNREVPYGAD